MVRWLTSVAAIFTIVEVLVEPLLTRMALRSMPALRGSVALVVTFIGLLVTVLVTDGLDINGGWIWVAATIIVWLGGLIAGLTLPASFLKRAVDDEPGRRDRRGHDLLALTPGGRCVRTDWLPSPPCLVSSTASTSSSLAS